MKKAVVTVIGKDMVGILAKVSGKCAEYNANVIEVTQSVMQELFTMVMLIDITNINDEFANMVKNMKEMGEKENLQIHVMHEDIFNVMHKI